MTRERRAQLKDLRYHFINVTDWIDVQASGADVPKGIQRGWKVLDIRDRALLTAIVMRTIREARRTNAKGGA